MDAKQMEANLQRLLDIEEIKCLMGKYFRCLDTKQWDEIRTCFSPDIHTEYCDGRLIMDGPDALVEYFSKNMPETMLSQHNGHTPEIYIQPDGTAKAHWYLNDYLILLNYDRGVRGTAIYTIHYKKVDGAWKISEIGYKRIFEEGWNRKNYEDRNIVTNMFQGQIGGKVHADD